MMTFDESHTLIRETAQMVSDRLGDAPGNRCRELLARADELLAAARTGSIDPGRALLIAADIILEAAGHLENQTPHT
jgi:hypothetical protein